MKIDQAGQNQFTCMKIESAKELDDLKKRIDRYSRFVFSNRLETNVINSQEIFFSIREEWGRIVQENQIVVTKDKIGLVQAIGIYKGSSAYQKGLYLEFLVSAPWNVDSVEDERKVRGAGSAIIDYCKKAAKEEKVNRILANAIVGSREFYTRHEFKKLNEQTWIFEGNKEETSDFQDTLP